MGYIRALDITQDNKFLVSGGYDGKILIWNVSDDVLIGNLKQSYSNSGSNPPVYSLKFSLLFRLMGLRILLCGMLRI